MKRSFSPRWLVAASAALAVLVNACSSAPPPRFHTLMPPAASAPPVAVGSAGPLNWEVLPVTVPAQVDQPQWVVRTVDGSLAVLEQERWIAPLGEEIRGAVVEQLTLRLGVPAVSADAGKRWRVRVDVQRFDSVPGREVRLGAIWTLSAGGTQATELRCRSELVEPVTSFSYLALANAHRTMTSQLADAMARALTLLNSGAASSCAG